MMTCRNGLLSTAAVLTAITLGACSAPTAVESNSSAASDSHTSTAAAEEDQGVNRVQDKILGDSSKEEILEAFHAVNADRFSEDNRDIGQISASVDDTFYLFTIDLQDDTVESVLDAHTTERTDVYAYDEELDVHVDLCSATKECIDEAADHMSGYLEAFAHSQELRKMWIPRKGGASVEYVIHKTGPQGNPEQYREFLAQALNIRHELDKLDLADAAISQSYVHQHGRDGDAQPLTAHISVFRADFEDPLCPDHIRTGAAAEVEAALDTLSTRIPMAFEVTCSSRDQEEPDHGA